jgi:hypothetical protein
MPRFETREEYERWKRSRTGAPISSPQPPAPRTSQSPSATERGDGAGLAVKVLSAVGLLAAAALLIWAGYRLAPAPNARAAGVSPRAGPMPRFFSVGVLSCTSMALGYLLRRADADAAVEDGERVLRYPRVWRWIVPLSAPMPLFLLGFSWGLPRNREFFVVPMLGMTLLWLFSALEVFLAEIRLREDGLAKRTLLGKRVRISWEAIRAVSYNPGWQWFVISTRDARVRVSLYSAGLTSLADELQRRAPTLAGSDALRLMRSRKTSWFA